MHTTLRCDRCGHEALADDDSATQSAPCPEAGCGGTLVSNISGAAETALPVADIECECPSCHHGLIIARHAAGTERTCPGCGNPFVVPDPDAAPSAAPHWTPPPPPPPVPRHEPTPPASDWDLPPDQPVTAPPPLPANQETSPPPPLPPQTAPAPRPVGKRKPWHLLALWLAISLGPSLLSISPLPGVRFLFFGLVPKHVESLEIPPFHPDMRGSWSTGTKVEISQTPDQPDSVTYSGAFETVMTGASSNGGFQELTWHPGAQHTYRGKVRIHDCIFDSDDEAPLVFQVNREKGYVYQSGKGVVTNPDGKSFSLGCRPALGGYWLPLGLALLSSPLLFAFLRTSSPAFDSWFIRRIPRPRQGYGPWLKAQVLGIVAPQPVAVTGPEVLRPALIRLIRGIILVLALAFLLWILCLILRGRSYVGEMSAKDWAKLILCLGIAGAAATCYPPLRTLAGLVVLTATKSRKPPLAASTVASLTAVAHTILQLGFFVVLYLFLLPQLANFNLEFLHRSGLTTAMNVVATLAAFGILFLLWRRAQPLIDLLLAHITRKVPGEPVAAPSAPPLPSTAATTGPPAVPPVLSEREAPALDPPPLPSATPPACPQCGNARPQGAKFCPVCGCALPEC